MHSISVSSEQWWVITWRELGYVVPNPMLGIFSKWRTPLHSMLPPINDFYSPVKGMDRRVWTGTIDGRFSVASLFLAIKGSTGMVAYSLLTSLWQVKVLPRDVAFWLDGAPRRNFDHE